MGAVNPVSSTLLQLIAGGPIGVADQQQAQRANTALTRAQVPLVQQQTTGAGLQNRITLNQLNQASIIQQAIRNISGAGANPGTVPGPGQPGYTGGTPMVPINKSNPAPSAPNPNQPYSQTNPRQMIDRTGGQQALPQPPAGFTLDQVPGGTQ